MDPESKDLVKTASSGVAEGAVRAFLEKVCGPLVELGDLVRDGIRFKRWERQLEIADKATAILEARGIEPSQVSLKILVPLLEAASLEDDEGMKERWANLLANAAAGGRGAHVLPSFPRILSELPPEEALILDAVNATGSEADLTFPGGGIPPLLETVGLRDDALVGACVLNLRRLGLLDVVAVVDEAFGKVQQRLDRTALGHIFVEACARPEEMTGAQPGAQGS